MCDEISRRGSRKIITDLCVKVFQFAAAPPAHNLVPIPRISVVTHGDDFFEATHGRGFTLLSASIA